MPASRARLAALYARSAYRVRLPAGGHATIVPGHALPRVLRDHLPAPDAPWGFITAWNPRSRPLAATVNRERQRRLLAGLRSACPQAGIHAGAGVGHDEQGQCWREPSLFVTGMPLGDLWQWLRRFEQNAMLCGTGDTPARLVWSDDPAP